MGSVLPVSCLNMHTDLINEMHAATDRANVTAARAIEKEPEDALPSMHQQVDIYGPCDWKMSLNFSRAELILGIIQYICHFYQLWILNWCRQSDNLFLEHYGTSILHMKYHSCWYPGGVRSHPDSKVYVAHRGPPGSCRPQVGPMLAPWTLPLG